MSKHKDFLSYYEEFERYKQMQLRRSESCRKERVLRMMAQSGQSTKEQIVAYELFRKQHRQVYKDMAEAEIRWASFQSTQKNQSLNEVLQSFVSALENLSIKATEKKQEEAERQQTFESQMDSPIMREIEETARAYMINPKSVKEQFLTKQERTNSSSAAGRDSGTFSETTPQPEPNESCSFFKNRTVQFDSDEAIERLHGERSERRFSFSSEKDDPTLDLSEEL
jgi:hypothetical protein